MAKPLLVEIFGDASQYQRTLDKAAGRTRRFGVAAKLAGGLLVTGLAIGLEQSVKAAIEAEKSQARLTQAFKNQGIAIAPLKASIDAVEASGRKLGFTDDATRNSLGSLVTATGNYKKAVQDLTVVQDLARFKHIDLEQATKMLTMAMTGSQRAVKQLGIIVQPVTTHMDALRAKEKETGDAATSMQKKHAQLLDKMATGQAIIDATKDKVHGQGKAYANTAAGGMEQFKAQMKHLEEQAGKHLIPALTEVVRFLNNKLIPALENANGWYEKHRGWVQKNAAALPHLIGQFEGLSNVLHGVAGAIHDVLNPLIQLWKWLIKLTGKVWNIKINIPTPHIPDIHVPGVHWPGKAMGGPVQAMQPYIVGEQGRELFVPGTSGRIIPNAQLATAGGGRPFHVNLNLDGRTIASLLVDPLRNEVRQLQRRGGRF